MKTSKVLFIACIFLSAVLFLNGLLEIVSINDRTKNRNIEYTPPNSGYIPRTEGTHDESSITMGEPVNLLVLGLDEEEERSDVILLLNFCPGQTRLNILSVARDTRVYVKGKPTKINALISMGGERLVAEKIKQLTGLKVNYYLTLNFTGFRRVIDTLGGVEFNIPFNMDYDDPDQNLHIHLSKGYQMLDGEKAEQLVRYRKGNKQGQGYIDGDIGRINTQQDFIKALIQQKVKLRYISKVDDVYLILKEYTNTNVDISDVRYYLKDLRNIKYDDINVHTIPGDSIYTDHIWYFIYDRVKTNELIRRNFFK